MRESTGWRVKIPSGLEKFRNARDRVGDFLHKATGTPVAPRRVPMDVYVSRHRDHALCRIRERLHRETQRHGLAARRTAVRSVVEHVRAGDEQRGPGNRGTLRPAAPVDSCARGICCGVRARTGFCGGSDFGMAGRTSGWNLSASFGRGFCSCWQLRFWSSQRLRRWRSGGFVSDDSVSPKPSHDNEPHDRGTFLSKPSMSAVGPRG